MLHIEIISTGGTIEKTYDELEGALENKATQLESRILSKLRLPYLSYNVTPILSKDSLHFDDNDRNLVVETVREKMKGSSTKAIVVIHGTDTMA